MIKLRKYLKPHLVGIFVIIGLLFVQAFSDLNLPNYMSDIVNVGIQQSGIENASPDALSENGFRLIVSMLDEDEAKLWQDSYELVAVNSDANYPFNDSHAIYKIKDSVESTVRDQLNVSTGRSVWTLINVMKELNPESNASGSLTTTSDIDLETIYNVLPMLENLPEATLAKAQDAANALDDSTLVQTGVVIAKSFYTELGKDTEQMQMHYIVIAGLKMVGITLVGTAATIIVGFLASKIGARVAHTLRSSVFSKVMNFSNNEFDEFSSSSLITRTTNDISQVQMLVTFGLRLFFYAPIVGVGGILMIQNDNQSMTWIIAVAVAALIALILVIFIVAVPKFKITQKLIDKVNLVARESLTGLMVVRAFGTQDFEADRFDKANTDLAKVTQFVNIVMATMMPMMMLIMNLTTLLIVWIGAHQIADASMQIGSMMAFIQYTMQIIFAFVMIAMMFIMIPRAEVSAQRISEVLTREESIKNADQIETIHADEAGVVNFDHVYFKYKGAQDDVLQDISFTARPGETTAFIGSTGSGKSTVVNLIPRFYDVTEGSITVGGVDVRQVDQKALRDLIGYVPQKGMLLSGSIRSNIAYGAHDASDDELWEAIDIAQGKDFVENKEEGIETHISQGGTNVSGGQRQRLSIARALAKKAPILIFDDSFSALDMKTDKALREALASHMKDTTVIIVAQRVNTIINADQIIVLDNGRIVGQGKHEDLLKNCEAYYEIASSQLSEEELNHESV